MAIKTLYSAESWDKIYKAFEVTNFKSFDYETIKLSLLDYLKFYYPENFNDYIESSSLIAQIEAFAVLGEQLAYRTDMSAHENFITSTERKQNILKLVKLISYNTTRNVPVRGLVKLTSVSCSEDVRDSQNNSLANKNIVWNDPNNPFWKEQFFAVMNKILAKPFGNPLKSFQVDDTVFQLYEVSNNLTANTFVNGVSQYNVNVADETIPFEIVPADIDEYGVFERAPSLTSNFSILYSDDGYGDASDTTGFMMFTKQGRLQRLPFNFDVQLQNRMLDVTVNNINNTDVWVQKVDPVTNAVIESWEKIESVNQQNIFFNVSEARKKYEISTLENDQIRLLFGDGDFADIPVGFFNVWIRSSLNRDNVIIPKSKIVDNGLTFGYQSHVGLNQSATFKYSLTTSLQNGSASEDIEHIRTYAPTTYYSQNRMVNGQDYNTFLLRDPTILRLKAINRTFSGQPKYIRWNDPTGQYQNVKIFGNDLRIYQNFTSQAIKDTSSSRVLIDRVIEPLLAKPGLINVLAYQLANVNSPFNQIYIKPRTKFIEDKTVQINNYPVLEKTEIQAALDRHWYGEADQVVYYPETLNITDQGDASIIKKAFAVVDGDTDHLIHDANIQLVKKNPGINESGFDPADYPYVKVNETSTNTSGIQEASNRFKRFGIKFTTNRPIIGDPNGLTALYVQQTAIPEYISIQVISDEGALLVHGSVTGIMGAAQVGETFSNDRVTFKVVEDELRPFRIGDAYVFEIRKNTISNLPTLYGAINATNVAGRFEVIEESLISDQVISQPFKLNDVSRSWLIIVERVEDTDGNFLYWNIITRDLNLVVQSDTTKFWYNNELNLIDGDTKKKVKDTVSILKSNLNKTRSLALGINDVYDVISDVKNPDGSPNNNSLVVSPTDFANTFFSGDGYPDNPMQFINFITKNDYVYFERVSGTDTLKPIPRTPYLESNDLVWGIDTNGNDTTGIYVRKPGRDGLDFLWQHFTPFNHLIDPSVSNVIDTYVLTRGYYTSVLNYIRGIFNIEPTPPTSLELRNNYRDLLTSKMISDTVVMHSGKLKLLFGNLAVPELRSSFKIIQKKDSKVTADQLKIKVLNIIDEYFRIENWDFGQTFYATELIAVIHKELPIDIDTVVIVPTFPVNYFGSLFIIEAGEDEILHSAATINDIEIVKSLDKNSLKQKT